MYHLQYTGVATKSVDVKIGVRNVRCILDQREAISFASLSVRNGQAGKLVQNACNEAKCLLTEESNKEIKSYGLDGQWAIMQKLWRANQYPTNVYKSTRKSIFMTVNASNPCSTVIFNSLILIHCITNNELRINQLLKNSKIIDLGLTFTSPNLEFVPKRTKGTAALRYFPSTIDQKGLKNEIAENLKKNVRTLGCEEARSKLSEWNIRQKMFLTPIFTRPGDHSGSFLIKSSAWKNSENFSGKFSVMFAFRSQLSCHLLEYECEDKLLLLKQFIFLIVFVS